MESGLKVAFMGTKTFRLEKGAQKTEVQFNYSEDLNAKNLWDWCERMTESAQHRINLDRAAKYDNLGVRQGARPAGSAVERKRVVGLEQYLPHARSHHQERKLHAHGARARVGNRRVHSRRRASRAIAAMYRGLLIAAPWLWLAACRKLPHVPRFAIELQRPRRRLPLAWWSTTARQRFSVAAGLSAPGLRPAHQPPAGWETLELNYAEDGDKVKVTVYALHQEYDARRHATIFRSQKLGAHTARLQESVHLAELQQLGYLPFSLRVVPVK